MKLSATVLRCLPLLIAALPSLAHATPPDCSELLNGLTCDSAPQGTSAFRMCCGKSVRETKPELSEVIQQYKKESATLKEYSFNQDKSFKKIFTKMKLSTHCSDFFGLLRPDSDPRPDEKQMQEFCKSNEIGQSGFMEAEATCNLNADVSGITRKVPMTRSISCTLAACKSGADACLNEKLTKAQKEAMRSARLALHPTGSDSDAGSQSGAASTSANPFAK
jgi:hypothetical protein